MARWWRQKPSSVGLRSNWEEEVQMPGIISCSEQCCREGEQRKREEVEEAVGLEVTRGLAVRREVAVE